MIQSQVSMDDLCSPSSLADMLLLCLSAVNFLVQMSLLQRSEIDHRCVGDDKPPHKYLSSNII